MLYNQKKFPQYVATAGKITILSALTGVVIVGFVFLFNIGQNELQKAEATSTATTTLTVLNTPPQWVPGEEGREEFPSSTSTPTNSGLQVSWIGRATDANSAPYFLIICSNAATPTPATSSTPGTNPPSCSSGGIRWAVSTGTPSGVQARAATTTTEALPFGESNSWFAWVCDDDATSPRCSTAFSTGTAATNSSPFNVNRRPVFTTFGNNGPVNPGALLTFTSTSSDPDAIPGEDNIFLIVCRTNSYSTTTNQCGAGDFLASTSIGVTDNATATFTLPAIIQDTSYNAFGFLYDQHGHSATGGAHGTNVAFTVNNVAPTVAGGTISLNGGTDISLTTLAGQTTGFTLTYTVADANSCDAVGGGLGDEMATSVISVLRSGIGTTTCNGSAGSYNPNNCYPSGVSSAVWNLSCTASSTSCTSNTDDTMVYSCTFPLWFIADPTVVGTPFAAQNWTAGVAGVDNNGATGTMATATSPVELNSLVGIQLLNPLIPYDQLEAGNQMANLTASTTIRAVGNTGLNQLLGGDSMCTTYTPTNPCPVSATSTIPQSEQRYATTAAAYALGTSLQPTSTPALFDIRIPKPTSTSTPSNGTTFWGIRVPGTIQLAGAYTGRNIFIGAVSGAAFW